MCFDKQTMYEEEVRYIWRRKGDKRRMKKKRKKTFTGMKKIIGEEKRETYGKKGKESNKK